MSISYLARDESLRSLVKEGLTLEHALKLKICNVLGEPAILIRAAMPAKDACRERAEGVFVRQRKLQGIIDRWLESTKHYVYQWIEELEAIGNADPGSYLFRDHQTNLSLPMRKAQEIIDGTA